MRRMRAVRGSGGRVAGYRAYLPGLLALWAICTPLQAHGQNKPREGLIPGTIPAYAASLFSSEPSSTENALTLLLPTGAKAVGMGRAVTAAEGSESAFWNPAGLAPIGENRFVVLRGSPLAGEATAFSLVLARPPLGVLAFSYQLLDLGDQDFTDKDQNVIGTVSFRDHLGIVSVATEILPGLNAGVNFKIFQTRVSCRGQCADAGVTGTAYALDFGIQSRPFSNLPLRLGAMVAHAGPDLQIINAEQADPLPTRARIAGSYEVLNHFTEREDLELWAAAELEDRLRELGSPVLYLGAEFVAGRGDQIFVRAGYGQGQSGQLAGTSVGLGIRYQQFEVGIGKSLSGTSLSDQTEPAHVTFGVLF
jgi:hypothetical protein